MREIPAQFVIVSAWKLSIHRAAGELPIDENRIQTSQSPYKVSTNRHPSSPLATTTRRNRRREVIVLAVIVGLTAVVYGQTLGFEFVNFDDDAHVFRNVHVRTGWTADNVRWAFGIHGPSQWHPLAWLSHQTDAAVFGANTGDSSASGHHAINVLLHLFNVVLVFLCFRDITGQTIPALLSAAAFGLHPLNVESVAWISERRNVLCLGFYLMSIRAYWRYVHHGGRGNYLILCILHAAALMAKPLAVTLPCVLWMLDVWPLRRFSRREALPVDASSTGIVRNGWIGAIVDKLPLLLLSVISCVLTVECQQAAGVVSSLKLLPFGARMENALAAYGDYLRDFVWPVQLCVFYPHPAIMNVRDPAAQVFSACIGATFLITITVLSYIDRRARPWLLFGWLWFLGTLVPMIGLVQVGVQQRADRYLYLPMLGLLLALTTSLPWDWICQRTWSKRLAAAAYSLLVLALAFRTWNQVATWRDSLTLFEQALAVNAENPFAHLNAGIARQERGESDRAAVHYSAALRLKPDYALAHYNLGVLEWELGRQQSAASHFHESIRLDSQHADAWVRRGAYFGMNGQLDLAEHDFLEASRIDPEHADAVFNLGLIREHRGQLESARESYQEALRRDPAFARAADALTRLNSR
ncbi:MAG: tetratricopeptide repeat protein [Planctomycetes bacterium]|nr:tetratricopeptide repeat protein [Planctomycetota bacterium]